jgi:hypothetical protein
MVLRIFGPRMDKVTGEWRRLHKEELNDLYCSPNILRVIKSRKRKLKIFENMVLRRIFGPRRDEVTGEWRRLHNEELNDLYSSPNTVRVIKLRRIRWAGLARMGEERGIYKVLVGETGGKETTGES